MYHQIRISDETLRRLKAMAEPYTDREPEDTIRRLLDGVENPKGNGELPESSGDNGRSLRPERNPMRRAARERGAIVEIEEHRLQAVSVRDLYEQALKLFVDEHGTSIERIVPFSTSRQRHLLAKSARHPTGNSFVVPVRYNGYYMEAHKDYRNAVRHLGQLAARLGLSMRYLG
ncbi:MAG: hypothetical protein ABI836_02365 [Gemmatimonadota bacterium]